MNKRDKRYVKHCQKFCASIWLALFLSSIGICIVFGDPINWMYTIIAPGAYAGLMYTCLILHYKYNLSGLFPTKGS